MPWHPGRPVAVVGNWTAAVRRWGLEEAVAAA